MRKESSLNGKRAAISVVVMVIVTLFMFISILIAINYSSSKISENFNTVSQLNDVYARQQGYENTLYFKLVESFLDSYQKVLKDNSIRIGNDNSLSLGEVFRLEVDSNFRKVDDDSSPTLKELFSKSDPLVFDGENIYVKNSMFNTGKEFSVSNSQINYVFVLNTSLGFDRLELPSFDDIIKVHSECNSSANKDNIEVCLNQKIPNFNAALECFYIDQFGVKIPSSLRIIDAPNQNLMGDEECVIKMKSRDKYYLNKNMANIEFELNFDFLLKK